MPNERPNSLNLNYIPSLDGLRAIAVLCVLYSHWVPEKYHYGVPWGILGVQLFFVLSGFLITRILLRCRAEANKSKAIKAFYIRRALRIFPPFYALLCAGFVIGISPLYETVLWHVSYLSNFYFLHHGDWHGNISHFWSLAVEEQFYLFWPAVILLIKSVSLRIRIWCLIWIGILSRLSLPQIFPNTNLLMVLPNYNFDSLGLGALLAINGGKVFEKYQRWPVFSPELALFFISFLAYAVLVFVRPIEDIAPMALFWERSMMVIMIFSLVAISINYSHKIFGQLLSLWPLTYLGKISYGVYIFHNFADIPVSLLVKHTGWQHLQFGFTNLGLLTFFTLFISMVSWHCLEKPCNSLKRFFPYSGARFKSSHPQSRVTE